MMALGALHSQKSMFQSTALEILREFLLYMHGQSLALQSHDIPELRVMSLDDLVKKCPFRAVTLVWRAEW